jgi:hypothetical protein
LRHDSSPKFLIFEFYLATSDLRFSSNEIAIS